MKFTFESEQRGDLVRVDVRVTRDGRPSLVGRLLFRDDEWPAFASAMRPVNATPETVLTLESDVS